MKNSPIHTFLAAGCLAFGLAPPATAQSAPLPAGQLAQQECSACHDFYPPEFLPAESWVAITQTLSDHFGEDASLPDDQVALIRDFLVSRASRRFSGIDPANPPLRITELSWYRHEHGARLLARAKADPSIGTLSHCSGCHRMSGAEN